MPIEHYTAKQRSDDPYTTFKNIPDAFKDKLKVKKLTPVESLILWFVLDKAQGFQQVETRVSYADIAFETEVEDYRKIARTLYSLEKKGLMTIEILDGGFFVLTMNS